MSTSRKSGPIYFEFPDFGFGPASTSLELISRLADEFECRIISSGTALELAQATLPQIAALNVDTFHPESWPTVRVYLPPATIVISNTNLPFAAWAIEQGYRVGIMDTLHWMWDEFPEPLNRGLFYVTQYYFGTSRYTSNFTPRSGLKIIHARPIINESRWVADRPPVRRGKAIIAFGGMKLPLNAELPAEYVKWALRAILPILFESGHVNEVSIVGGLANLKQIIPEIWRNDPRIHIQGFLTPDIYRDELLSAKYHLLTPGLTSMYEVQAAKLYPFFLPGFNMSQVLQASHLRNGMKYEHVAEWPRMARVYGQLAGCSEEKGVNIVSEMVLKTMVEESDSPLFLVRALRNYMETTLHDTHSRFPTLTDDAQPLLPIDVIVRPPLLNACDMSSGMSN